MAYNIQLKTINSIANFIAANGGILLSVFKHDDEYTVLSMRLDSPYAKKEYLHDTIVSELDGLTMNDVQWWLRGDRLEREANIQITTNNGLMTEINFANAWREFDAKEV